MQVALTERFLRDFQGLSGALGNKCRELLGELRAIARSELRTKAIPGWRLHALRGSDMISLSVDMNFRLLAELTEAGVIVHRVVKHDTADRSMVNRNVSGSPIAEIAEARLSAGSVYEALRAFGIAGQDLDAFRNCETEDALLDAAARVSPATANLALALYETSNIVIPKARFHVIASDADLQRALEQGGSQWQLYLHPSQQYVVELPASFRASVVGSAGTGKTICAWHRIRHLEEHGLSVGFVCAHESALEVSAEKLSRDGRSDREDRGYFLVPRNADELLQLAEAVDHLVIDEAQEIPVTWLSKLGSVLKADKGITLFYDLNQLGGNIKNGDTSRYRRRISDWKMMLASFPQLQKFIFGINYRNAREVAECYLDLLSEALPAKPSAEVPVFETGEVVRKRVNPADLDDVLASLIGRLLKEHQPGEIAVVPIDVAPGAILSCLSARRLPVGAALTGSHVSITSPDRIRGHERPLIVVVMKGSSATRNFGKAIECYVAMSRAIRQLIILELDAA